MTAILDSVVKEGFTEEVMSSLRSEKGERGRQAKRQKHSGCIQGRAKRLVWVKQSDSAHSGREVREVSRATCLRGPHPRKGTYPQPQVEERHAGGPGCCQTREMAICWHSRFSVQQLCQHLASSPVPSHRSNTAPLRCPTSPKSSLPPEGGKTHSLIENANLFLNITTQHS